MNEVTTLYRELASLANPTIDLNLQQAQRTGQHLYELINDPDGFDPFFAEQQLPIHEMLISSVASGLGSSHRAIVIVKALILAAKNKCGS